MEAVAGGRGGRPPQQAAATSVQSSPASPSRYSLKPIRICSEDILFCVDVDAESRAEMNKSRSLTRIEAIKQGLALFVHTKLTMSPDHRFAFATLGQTVNWLRKDFSNDIDSVKAAIRALTPVESSHGFADITQLFRIASSEAKKSIAMGRIFRVILIYCRSSVRPQHQWPVSKKNFTMDVIYLHDKPGPENCPQKVYDALVDALEHVTENEGYILESGMGMARALFRIMCILLSHPQQRCLQDDLDVPKSLTRKAPTPADGGAVEEILPPHSQ